MIPVLKKIIRRIAHFLLFSAGPYQNRAFGRAGILLLATAILINSVIAPLTALAAINQQINYQGKLTDSSDVAVSDGNYSIVFSLYTAATGGAAIWTETKTVSVDNGLFSVMLGADTSLASVNFNQTLYLGVKVGSDSEMTPRKIIGAVPAAFEADKLDGLDSTSFVLASTTTLPNIWSLPGLGQYGSSSATTTALGNLAVIGTTIFSGLVSGYQQISAPFFTATSTTQASTFPYASSTALTATIGFFNNILATASTTLQNFTGVNATTTSATTTNLAITGLGQGWLHVSGPGAGVTSSTSPTIAYLTATSTTATSTFYGNVQIIGNLLTSGASTTASSQAIFTHVPTLPHTFGSWSIGASGSNVSDATIYINPATAAEDTNLLGLAVGGSVKFLVDADGDIFGNSLTLVGGSTLSTSTISTLIVENNSFLGDSASSDWTHIKGSAWVESNKSSGASTTALTVTQTGSGDFLRIAADYTDAAANFVIKNGGNVGIGTSTPNWLLQMAGTRPFFALSDTSSSANLKHWTLSSQGGNLYFATSSDALATSTIAALTVNRNGWLGVGTTTPGAVLASAGQALAQYFTAFGTQASSLPYASSTALTATIGFFNNILATASTTLQNFTGVNATTTSATTTNLAITGLGQGWLHVSGPGAGVTSSTSPTIAYLTATSTTATSTFYGNVQIIGNLLTSGASTTASSQAIFTHVPTLPHTFGSWSIGASGSNVSDATIYINPATAAEDTNLLGLAVGGSVKFLVDADGDIFGNSLTLVGGSTLSTSTISTLIVENNSFLGDSASSDWTHIKGSAWVESNKSSGASTTALTVTQTGSGDFLRVATDYASAVANFIIKNSGLIGVGTSSPFAKFSIHANSNETNTSLFEVGSSTASATTTLFKITNTGNVGIGLTSPTASLHIQGSGIQFEGAADNLAGKSNVDFITYSHTASPTATDRGFGFYSGSGSTHLMSILNNGNVGIGTTSPYAKLSVVGPVVAEYFHATSTTATSTFAGDFRIGGSTGIVAWVNEGNAIVAQGSLSIGGTSPENGLSVTRVGGTDATFARFRASASGSFIQILASGGGAVMQGRDTSAARWQLLDTNGHIYFAQVAGDFGFGVSSPTARMQIATSTTASSTTKWSNSSTGSTITDGFEVGIGADGNNWIWGMENTPIKIGTNNVERLTVTAGGNVGVGTTSPSAALAITGGIFTTASSTLMNGIDLTAGCFSIRGTCFASGGSGTVNTGAINSLAYYPGTGTTVDDATGLLWLSASNRLVVATSTGSASLDTNFINQGFAGGSTGDAGDSLYISYGGDSSVGGPSGGTGGAGGSVFISGGGDADDNGTGGAGGTVTLVAGGTFDSGGSYGADGTVNIGNMSGDRGAKLSIYGSATTTGNLWVLGGKINSAAAVSNSIKLSSYDTDISRADDGISSSPTGGTGGSVYLGIGGRGFNEQGLNDGGAGGTGGTLYLAGGGDAGDDADDTTNGGAGGTINLVAGGLPNQDTGGGSYGNDGTVNIGNSAGQKNATLNVYGTIGVMFRNTATTNGVCHSGSDLDGTDTTNSYNLVACNNGAGDIAEFYPTKDDVETGHIVATSDELLDYQAEGSDPRTGETLDLGPAKVAVLQRAPVDGAGILGVVSKAPFQTFGKDVLKAGTHHQPVALVGRVSVKVKLDNGEINAGDLIALSTSTPGVGVKAIQSGVVIGTALNDFTADSNVDGDGVGEVMVFINLSYRKISSSVNNGKIDGIWTVDDETGDIKAFAALDLAGFEIRNVRAITSASGKWSIDENGKLLTQDIETKRLLVEEGVTTRDKKSGDYYCIYVEGGSVKTDKGRCEDLLDGGDDIEDSNNGGDSPAPESESEPEPEPEPEVTPEPEPAPEDSPQEESVSEESPPVEEPAPEPSVS